MVKFTEYSVVYEYFHSAGKVEGVSFDTLKLVSFCLNKGFEKKGSWLFLQKKLPLTHP